MLLGVAGIAVTLFAWWLHSSGDLDAEADRARALGLPMRWQDLAAARPPPPDQAILHRLQATAGRATAASDAGRGWQWDPFAPPPAGLAAWDSGVDADLDALLVQLSGTPAWSIDEAALAAAAKRRDPTAVLLGIYVGDWDLRGEAREILISRSGRGRDDPTLLAEALTRLACTPAGITMYAHQVSLRTGWEWCLLVLRHRDRLDPALTAAAGARLADGLDALLPPMLAAQPLILDALLRADPHRFMRACNVRLLAIMQMPGGLRVLHRLGRGLLLARAIDAAAWVAAHGPPRTWADLLAAVPSLPNLSDSRNPRQVLARTLDGWNGLHYGESSGFDPHILLFTHLRITLQIRLLAADLAGAPWPADPCDPAGGPLRPIMRAGAVIGAYSLGPDGVDDGGTVRTDWCWPLRARLGSPKAADPLPPP